MAESLILAKGLAVLLGMKRNVWVWRATYEMIGITLVVGTICSTGSAFRSTNWRFLKVRGEIWTKGSFLFSLLYRKTPPDSPSPCLRMTAMSRNVLPTRGLNVGMKLRCSFSVSYKGAIWSVNKIQNTLMCNRKKNFTFRKPTGNIH